MLRLRELRDPLSGEPVVFEVYDAEKSIPVPLRRWLRYHCRLPERLSHLRRGGLGKFPKGIVKSCEQMVGGSLYGSSSCAGNYAVQPGRGCGPARALGF